MNIFDELNKDIKKELSKTKKSYELNNKNIVETSTITEKEFLKCLTRINIFNVNFVSYYGEQYFTTKELVEYFSNFDNIQPNEFGKSNSNIKGLTCYQFSYVNGKIHLF